MGQSAVLSVSSNGSIDSTAILWAGHAAGGDANQSVRPGILRAFSALDVTKELWNSSIANFTNPGNYAKFNCPTIANGKVYLATFSNKLVVYGLTDYVDGVATAPSRGPSLYPTAAKEVVHIARGEEAIKVINLFDLNGRLLWIIKPGTEEVVDIPVSSLSNGIYVVEIQTTGLSYREKLWVQH